MSPWPVAITKLKSDDGFWELLPSTGLKVGSEIEVDLDSRCVEERVRGDRHWVGEVISFTRYIAPDGKPYVCPCELLDL